MHFILQLFIPFTHEICICVCVTVNLLIAFSIVIHNEPILEIRSDIFSSYKSITSSVTVTRFAIHFHVWWMWFIISLAAFFYFIERDKKVISRFKKKHIAYDFPSLHNKYTFNTCKKEVDKKLTLDNNSIGNFIN